MNRDRPSPTRRERERTIVAGYDMCASPNAQFKRQAYASGYKPLVAKSSDGKLWFTSSAGASVLDPRHIPFNKLPPPVHIEQIIANHKSYLETSDANGNVRLPPRIRDLQIDYTALSLVAPEKVLFRYKLEGWDRDWQDAGTRRQAFYNNLPPRNYRFRVVACNNSGVWNEAGTFLDFSIAPAFYQTWWFRSLCVLAFLALVYGVIERGLGNCGRRKRSSGRRLNPFRLWHLFPCPTVIAHS